MSFQKIIAYAQKEWWIESSYMFAFLASVFGVFTTLAMYVLIDRLFQHQLVPDLAPFGTSYFAYALVGNAFFAYLGSALGGIPGRVAEEQTAGTLEAVLATPTSLWVLVLAMGLWSAVYASVEVLLYFLVGSVGFGVDVSQINWVTCVAILVLVIITFNSVGLMEAGCVLVFKRGAVVAWMFNGVWALLSGVFVPVSVLPSWAKPIAELLPMTHAIRALQLAIYQHASLAQVSNELAMLGLCGMVVGPLGWLSLRWAFERARREGSLSHA